MLCRALGWKSVALLEHGMDHRELVEWIELYRLEQEERNRANRKRRKG